MISQISKKDYQATFHGVMLDVTEKALPVMNIWPDVALLVNDGVVSTYVFENNLVERVYRNSIATYDHVLLPTSDHNRFVVIVINITRKNIAGYYLLNLVNEYGLYDVRKAE